MNLPNWYKKLLTLYLWGWGVAAIVVGVPGARPPKGISYQ
jgi:hypothetical protein